MKHDVPASLLAAAVSAGLLASACGSEVGATAPDATGNDDGPGGSPGFHPFGTVEIAPGFTAAGGGSNVDTIAFFDAPDPTASMMFVSSKGSGAVEVWNYPYQAAADEAPLLEHACLGTSTNGLWIDQATDLLYVTAATTPRVCVFALPGLSFVRDIDTESARSSIEPNLALINTQAGQKRLYVSYDSVVQIIDLANDSVLDSFTTTKDVETLWGDDFYQQLLAPDERTQTGVYVYDVGGASAGPTFGGDGIFQADEEGILMYTCPADGTSDDGTGMIVVSDQKTGINDYEVFDRKSRAHLGTIQLTGAAYTDGIASTQQASPEYPLGVFAALNDDVNVKGIGWDEIFRAIDDQVGEDKTFGCP